MKLALISLGCSKNLVDSERISGILSRKYGFELTSDPADGDVVVINTCGFIDSAKEESIDTIISCIPLKNKKCRCLAVTGCLVTGYKEELKKEIPEVDLWLTALDFETIGSRLSEMGLAPVSGCSSLNNKLYPGGRLLAENSGSAYLKIAEGCNNKCTFCTIPKLRGPYVSRPIEDILAEADELTAAGIKEINLLAQDTTFYGSDLYGSPGLEQLLEELAQKSSAERIRILYSYPHRITSRLIEILSREEKLCSYLDMPVQHASDKILKAMGRPERLKSLREKIKMIRDINPDFALRSTFMVGFPGETEEDFEILCQFLEEAAFDWVGVFSYSPQEGTPSAEMPNQVDEETKEIRYHETMALLSRISANRLFRHIGKTETVLIEDIINPDENSGCKYTGRTSFQAPDVDGITFIKAREEYKPGDMIKVKITGSDVYDLIAEAR